jgi:protease II
MRGCALTIGRRSCATPGTCAIRAHLEAESAYTEAVLADTVELQAELFAEMKCRIKEDDGSVPTQHGHWEYYSSYVTGGQYPRVSRQPSLRRFNGSAGAY